MKSGLFSASFPVPRAVPIILGLFKKPASDITVRASILAAGMAIEISEAFLTVHQLSLSFIRISNHLAYLFDNQTVHNVAVIRIAVMIAVHHIIMIKQFKT